MPAILGHIAANRLKGWKQVIPFVINPLTLSIGLVALIHQCTAFCLHEAEVKERIYKYGYNREIVEDVPNGYDWGDQYLMLQGIYNNQANAYHKDFSVVDIAKMARHGVTPEYANSMLGQMYENSHVETMTVDDIIRKKIKEDLKIAEEKDETK